MSDKMWFEIVQVTPEQAKQWLKLNLGNRKLNDNRVRILAEAIKRGEWRLTHQGLAFAPNGRLLDGQHRLAAIVASGQTVDMMVAKNVSEAAFIAMDVGRPRSASDILRISTMTAGVARFTLGLLSGYSQKGHVWTIQQIMDTTYFMQPWVESLMNFCPTKKRSRSSVPLVLAVICRMAKHPASYQWIGEQYKAWVMLDLPNIAPGPQALLKQFDRGVISTKFPDELLLRAFSAFDPGKAGKNVTKLQASESGLEEIKEVLQRLSRNHISNHHIAPKQKTLKAKNGEQKETTA